MKKELDKIRLEPTYPHKLLVNLGKLVRKNGSLLKDSDQLIKIYKNEYKDDIYGYNLLKLADRENILRKFQENIMAEEWKKRVCVKVAFNRLIQYISENDAITVVESCMHIYNCDISVIIEYDLKGKNVYNFHKSDDKERLSENQRFILDKKSKISEKIENKTFSEKNDTHNDILKNNHGVEVTDYVMVQNTEKQVLQNNAKRESGFNDKVIKSEKKAEKKLITEFSYYSKMSISQRKVLKKAINNNDKVSQCDMGDYYSEENSNHTDYEEAKKMYDLSAKQGYDRALLGLGRVYDQHPQEINDKKKALEIYTKLAEQGFSMAQFILGMKYRFGDTVDENIEKAIYWTTKAAEQGNIQAICNLADMYQAVHDNEIALKWLRIGASKGSEYCKKRLRM